MSCKKQSEETIQISYFKIIKSLLTGLRTISEKKEKDFLASGRKIELESLAEIVRPENSTFRKVKDLNYLS